MSFCLPRLPTMSAVYRILTCLVFLAAGQYLGSLVSAAENVEKGDFQRQIRPLLADKCFSCHGRDAEHREGNLRLDEREIALKGGDRGTAGVVPSQPAKSELVRRIFAADDTERMPPPDSKKDLTAAEKELLR